MSRVWLPDAFGDLLFPDALESFAREFGRRYSGHPAIASICPINEPLTTAFFAGDAGLWPPYGTGLQTYMFVLSRIAQALSRAIKALRETMESVEIIVCDSLEVAKTDEPESSEKTSPHLSESLGADVARRMERRHVVMDLVLGRLNDRHALYALVTPARIPSLRLKLVFALSATGRFDWPRLLPSYGGRALYYPRRLLPTKNRQKTHRALFKRPGLLAAIQIAFHGHVKPAPLAPIRVKLAWLQKCVSDVRRLRAAGFPCIGFTWWPLFDHLDWDGAMLHQTGHIHPVGIYSLRRSEHGELVREPTSLADHYRALIEHGDAAVGSVAPRRRRSRHFPKFLSTRRAKPSRSSLRWSFTVRVLGRFSTEASPSGGTPGERSPRSFC